MIEHSAQFNLFDYVCVNNERTGVIVDFDFVANQMGEQVLPESVTTSDTQKAQVAGSRLNEENAASSSSLVSKDNDEVWVDIQSKKRDTRPVQMHLSSVNQFISADVINKVDESQIENQVYYWVLCEQDENAVMAFVPEDLVTSADAEPSPKLLENLDAWCAQTNIQYQH